MKIITVDDLIKEFGIDGVPYFLNNNDEKEVDVDKCNYAIEESENTIFGYLRKAGIDVENISDDLKKELRQRTILLTRYNYSTQSGSRMEMAKTDFENIQKWLTDVSTGRVILSTVISKKVGWQPVRMVL